MAKPAPPHEPIPIGEVANPPFALLPDPLQVFLDRAARFRALAAGHDLGPYLNFLGDLAEIQARIQPGLPDPVWPPADALARSMDFGMPPLDRTAFTADEAMASTWDRLRRALTETAMPDRARLGLEQLDRSEAGGWRECMANVLCDSIPADGFAEHGFVAAALQVHFARLAARLDATRLVPVGDGACPACGGPPVASVIVGWVGAHGTRFCACALCGTLWNYVRIKCTLCGSTKGIAYYGLEGDAGTVKAETCDSCRGYVKILYQHRDASLDPVADDVATLAVDLLAREGGYRRGSVNPFLLGY